MQGTYRNGDTAPGTRNGARTPACPPLDAPPGARWEAPIRAGWHDRTRRHAKFIALLAGLVLAGPSQAADPVPPRRDVFIGGTGAGLAVLGEPGRVRHLLAQTRIGLYQHANGIAALTPPQRQALWSAWGLTPCGEGDTVGEVGGGPSPGYLAFACGRSPGEVNANEITGSGGGGGHYTAAAGDAKPGTAYSGYVTAGDLATMKAHIDFYVAKGAANVGVVLTPNDPGQDLDDPFATGAYWANARAAALHGGAIALDPPPSYAFARGPAYLRTVAQTVAWGNAHGLRTSLIVSPFALAPDTHGHSGNCGFDPDFAGNTRRLVAFLAAADSLPSQWVVETYCPAAPDGTPGTMNDIAPDDAATPDSLNAVALFLAALPPRPAGTVAPAGGRAERDAHPRTR